MGRGLEPAVGAPALQGDQVVDEREPIRSVGVAVGRAAGQ
jgi:hypothetical protein